MKILKLKWIGDIEIPEEKTCLYPPIITIIPTDKSVRLGRSNSTNPPHYVLESLINSRMLSRHHATIEYHDHGNSFDIQDHSINGTFVNYKRVKGRVILRQGDILSLGHTRGCGIPSGKSVLPYNTDLKFKVLLENVTEETHSSASPTHNQNTVNSRSFIAPQGVPKKLSLKRLKRKVTAEEIEKVFRRQLSAVEKGNENTDSNAAEMCAAQSRCLKPHDTSVDWVACDGCLKWFHMRCVHFPFSPNESMEQSFYCSKQCHKKHSAEK